jgi:tetratricopeptide (TPR) repeat protein
LRRLAPLLVGAALLAGTARAAVEVQPMRGLRAEIAALLVQGVAGGSLPIAVALFPSKAASDGESAAVAFLVEVPPAPEPPADPESGRALELYAYAVDDAGEVAGHFSVTLPAWPATGEGVKIAGRMEVGAREVSVRFLAFDPTGRRYGMAIRELSPDAIAVPPRFTESCDDWALADAGAAEVLVLSARPVLVAGERRTVSLPDAPPGAWRMELARGLGDAVVREQVEGVVVAPGEVEFVVPELAAGRYQLSLVPTEGSAWQSGSIEAWLVGQLPPAGDSCQRGWRRVLSHARSGGVVASPRTPPATGEAPSVELLASRYRAILERYASLGDLAVAADELAEMEAGVVAEDLDNTRPLFTAELRSARALADQDARCLLPLVSLHSQSYLVHHSSGRFPLATHSRRLAAAIAELAVDFAAQPEETSLLAVGITGLAQMVERRRSSLEAQRLLERALALDGSQEATRLLLAVSYDRKGRYDEAREQFEALVASNTAHQEARVRLAILLLRTGDLQQAEPLLRTVVAEQPPEWLLSLSYQTLGQLLIAKGRVREAIQVLAGGGIRLPGDQAIQVLRAYALDRDGRRREVQGVLAEMPLSEAGRTARFRYSDRPAAALELLRETLLQSVVVRLPVLASALGAVGAGGSTR